MPAHIIMGVDARANMLNVLINTFLKQVAGSGIGDPKTTLSRFYHLLSTYEKDELDKLLKENGKNIKSYLDTDVMKAIAQRLRSEDENPDESLIKLLTEDVNKNNESLMNEFNECINGNDKCTGQIQKFLCRAANDEKVRDLIPYFTRQLYSNLFNNMDNPEKLEDYLKKVDCAAAQPQSSQSSQNAPPSSQNTPSSQNEPTLSNWEKTKHGIGRFGSALGKAGDQFRNITTPQDGGASDLVKNYSVLSAADMVAASIREALMPTGFGSTASEPTINAGLLVSTPVASNNSLIPLRMSGKYKASENDDLYRQLLAKLDVPRSPSTLVAFPATAVAQMYGGFPEDKEMTGGSIVTNIVARHDGMKNPVKQFAKLLYVLITVAKHELVKAQNKYTKDKSDDSAKELIQYNTAYHRLVQLARDKVKELRNQNKQAVQEIATIQKYGLRAGMRRILYGLGPHVATMASL